MFEDITMGSFFVGILANSAWKGIEHACGYGLDYLQKAWEHLLSLHFSVNCRHC